MRYIVVQPWKVPDPREHSGYPIELRVVSSSHERFVVGHRFDYGFLAMALSESYSVIFLPAIEGNPPKRA